MALSKAAVISTPAGFLQGLSDLAVIEERTSPLLFSALNLVYRSSLSLPFSQPPLPGYMNQSPRADSGQTFFFIPPSP